MADKVSADFLQNSVTAWGFHPVEKLKGEFARNKTNYEKTIHSPAALS